MLEEEHFVWSIRLLGAEDCDESAGEEAHEVSQGQVVALALSAFTQVVAAELGVLFLIKGC